MLVMLDDIIFILSGDVRDRPLFISCVDNF